MQVNPKEVPNMTSEVQEAIEWYYKAEPQEVVDFVFDYFGDNPDIIVDCFKYLSHIGSDKMNQAIDSKLKEMGRCTRCGTKLIVCQHNEVHDELDGCPIETVYDKFCPECDVPYIVGEEVME